MYLRDTDFKTVGDLMEEVTDRRLYARCNSVDVQIHLEDGSEEPDSVEQEEGVHRRGTIVVGKKEIPANKRGLTALAGFYDIPTKFLERLPVDEQQFILEHRIQRSQPKPIVIRYDDAMGISEAYNGEHTRVSQEQLVESLLDVLPEESKVVDWHDQGIDWWGSIVVPEGYDRGIGGDKKVGDLTHGGVRFGRNVKQNLAPWVQTFLFRLVCTNGMEIPDYSLKVDARGMDELEIVASFRSEAKRAFEVVGRRIDDFYALREEKIGEDRTGVLRKMAQDAGIPDRMVGRLEDTLADALMLDQVDEATLFDLTNHITNAANAPGVRPSMIRTLQRSGGDSIVEHAARCKACHTRLSN